MLNHEPTKQHKDEAKYVANKLFDIFYTTGRLNLTQYEIGDKADQTESSCVVA